MAWIRARLVAALLFCASIHVIKGIQVGEDDLTITEGSTRQVSFRRSLSQSPLSLTVHVTTIEGYRQHLINPSGGCTRTLRTLGFNESAMDPAEDADLSTREYQLQYAANILESSLTLEVVDDEILEEDEVFILYTNITESSDDVCAILVPLRDNDLVQFNFSRDMVDITEGGCLPCVLSILKHGQNEPTLDVQVDITPTSTNLDEHDYMPNGDHVYMFTSNTSELPIATLLLRDMSAESPESFLICLRRTMLHSRARLIAPDCVTIRIFDDDSLLIGFTETNTSLTLSEGGVTQTVCVELKQGLSLDPHEIVVLTMAAVPEESGTEIEFGTEPLLIGTNSQRVCRTVTAFDDDISDGTKTFKIEIRSGDPADIIVPVNFSPDSIPVQVIDNDVTSFELSINEDGRGSDPSNLVEGDSVSNLLRITKTGRSSLVYRVNLLVRALNDASDPSELILATTVQLNFSNNTVDILDLPIQILEDLLPEKKKEFSIMIASIEAYNGNGSLAMGALTAIEGESITIRVYDNDIDVGFANNTMVSVAEGESSLVCASIVDIEPSDVNPAVEIPLQISVHNMTPGFLNISSSQISLSSTDFLKCFNINFPADNDVCDMEPRAFMLQLKRGVDDQLLTVNFRPQNVTVNINDAQDCASAVNAAAIVVPIILVLILIAIIVFVVVLLLYLKGRSHRYFPEHLEKKNSVEMTQKT